MPDLRIVLLAVFGAISAYLSARLVAWAVVGAGLVSVPYQEDQSNAT